LGVSLNVEISATSDYNIISTNIGADKKYALSQKSTFFSNKNKM